MGKPEEGSWRSGKLHRKKSDNNVHIKGFRKGKGAGTAGGLCTYRQRGWRCRWGTIDPMINTIIPYAELRAIGRHVHGRVALGADEHHVVKGCRGRLCRKRECKKGI